MKKLFLIICTGFIVQLSHAQEKQDPVLLTVEDDTVLLSEFEAIYKKNNSEDAVDPKSLEEYLELYINFKLKVKEAENLGLDTLESFKKELAGYKSQLQAPYLKDKSVTEKMIKEGYERMKTDVKASHILIKLPQNALPEDTQRVYNQMMEIRKKILKGATTFEEMAREVSQDPSVEKNQGDLGYFSAFYMVYPFENAAYNTEVGKISMPIRTRFGYHLVKVTDKRPARGEIKVAHIMVKSPRDASKEEKQKAENKINEIYQKLEEGTDFGELAKKYSDDKRSARKGGELRWFGTGRMVPEFENAAFSLEKDGDYSEPIRTDYGWHIIKRIDHKGIPPFEQIKDKVRIKVSRDARSDRSKKAFINKLKKEYDFEEYHKELVDFYDVVDQNYFKGEWSADKAKELDETMFVIHGNKYSQQDFARFLENTMPAKNKKGSDQHLKVVLNNKYKAFVRKSLIDYEKSRLKVKYDEYRLLLQEYRDGILLFDLTDRKVWSKSVEDSAGLQAFYEKHKQEFMWEKRVEADVYYAKDEKIASEARKMAKKAIRKEYSPADIKNEFNDESQLDLTVKSDKFSRGENSMVDKVDWKEGVSEIMQHDDQYVFVHIKEVLDPRPKTLKEARGLVTSAYQEHLEKAWIKELKDKYKVTVHREVLKKIK